MKYAFRLVTNTSPEGRTVEAREHAARESTFTTRPLHASWPAQVFSLAHVAIPFPEDDPIYGDGSTLEATPRLRIGHLSMRGERGVLTISADDLMRLRHNPFHGYMMERNRNAIGAGTLDARKVCGLPMMERIREVIGAGAAGRPGRGATLSHRSGRGVP